ncbi:MAG: Dabb family protein [Lachnospiraceae bacterium]|nr:Dabb family protein [Lachnospiraceae bacterium]
MVKHVILWKLKEKLSETEREQILADMKDHLEGLVGIVPGLRSLNVVVNKLDSSNADVMLDSALESEAALKGYQTHPEHVRVADTYVRPYTEVRLCIDYVE